MRCLVDLLELGRSCPFWRSFLGFVQPATVLRWHRAGFRLFWRLKSRPGRPLVDKDLRDCIATIARENPTWGAPRIQGVLLKLGFSVAEATVARYMPKHRGPRPHPGPDWKTFLHLHLDSSCGVDFFDIPTATFQVLRGFLVLDHKRRALLHLGVTAHPTAEWSANQLAQAFPEDSAPHFLFRDRDSIFGARFTARAAAMGIHEVISDPRSPWQNPSPNASSARSAETSSTTSSSSTSTRVRAGPARTGVKCPSLFDMPLCSRIWGLER